jgi:hypothetical protein
MKDPGVDPAKIQIVTAPKSIRASTMKKSPPTGLLFRHHIGVRRGCLPHGMKVPGVDSMLPAVVTNQFSWSIVADKTRPNQGKSNAATGQVDQQVVGSASGSRLLTENTAELFGTRIDIHHLDVIHDPVTARQHAGASAVG